MTRKSSPVFLFALLLLLSAISLIYYISENHVHFNLHSIEDTVLSHGPFWLPSILNHTLDAPPVNIRSKERPAYKPKLKPEPKPKITTQPKSPETPAPTEPPPDKSFSTHTANVVPFYSTSSSDTCAQFRKNVPKEERKIAVAGLFNTGTNLLQVRVCETR